MPILYKKAKEAVNKQYDELISRGYVPTLNADKETYSWVHKDTGEKYRGIDPTGGIDVDAGFGDVLKRNRRQRRLMSEKAGEAALENEQKKKLISVSSSGSAAKSDKEIELEKRIKELEDRQKPRDIVPPVPPVSGDDEAAKKIAEEAKKKAEEEAIKKSEEETKKAKEEEAARKLEEAKKAEEDKKYINADVGYYTGTPDPTVPYIYVEDKDLRAMKARTGIFTNISDFINSPGVTSAESKHRGAIVPMFGVEQDIAYPRKVKKDGKSYTLMSNPDFKERTYNVKDLNYVRSLYGDNASIRNTEINGKTYLRVTPGLAEKMANAAGWLQNFVAEEFIGASAANLKTLKTLKPVAQSTKAATTAATTAETVSGTAQSAAERELANEAARNVASRASASAKGANVGGPAGINPVNGQFEFNFEGGIPKGTYVKPAENAGSYAGRVSVDKAKQMKFSFADPTLFKDGGKVRFTFTK